MPPDDPTVDQPGERPAVAEDATVPPGAGLPDAATLDGDPAGPTPAGASPGLLPPGYELLGELGRGGMGVVYKARHQRLGRVCAVKMILAGGHAGPAEKQRFETEGQAIARLSHPGIVQVYEVGEHDGHPFMALEFCPGGSLDQRLRETPPTAREAAEMVRSLAEAMRAAHDANVIHRDLKPANVLLAADGALKITDFGLAKKLDEAGQTQTGAVMGTPSYMPPEQASGEPDLGPSVDVWAMGALLYECLSGRPPFRGATAMDTIFQVLGDEPVAVRQLNPRVPADLETICHKCLQKDPRKRYASAQALAEDLRRFLDGRPIQARPIGSLERGWRWVRRNPVVSALAAGVFLALTAGVAVSAWFAYAARREANTAHEQLRRSEWAVYAGKLGLAQLAFAVNDVPEAFRYLDACQWDLRGWEHRHLRRRFDASKQTLIGHARFVTSACFSPDGKRILTGSRDGTAKVWDAEKGTEVFALKGHPKAVTSVCFSPDGKRIATAHEDPSYPYKPGEAKVWDADKGTELLPLKGLKGAVLCVAFSPVGDRILTGSTFNKAQVWDAETGAEVLALNGHANWVRSVVFSPDGKRILTGSWDQTAKVWDAETGTELLALKGLGAWVRSAAFSPDGKRLIICSGDATPKVWDAETGTAVRTLSGHPGSVTSAAFSPDGKRIVVVGYSNTAKVWDSETGQELLALQGHSLTFTSVCISPDGKRILTGNDNTGKVWDADTGVELLALKGHTAEVTSVAFSPDGKRILTGSQDRTAKVWDADKGTELLALKGLTGSVLCVAFSPDGDRILTGCNDSTAKVWDAKKGGEILVLEGPNHGLTSVAFSRDGKRVFAWDVYGYPRAWSVANGQPVAEDDPPARPASGSARSPDGLLSAELVDRNVIVVNLLQPPPPTGESWPLPDLAERRRYHAEQAARVEQEGKWFAVAFHVGRLLLDASDNADLKKRRDDALGRHAAKPAP